MDLRLEVVVIPVADVDRAKSFYANALHCREDADVATGDDFRVVQMTPPGSSCSIIFGTGLTSAAQDQSRATSSSSTTSSRLEPNSSPEVST